MPKFCLIPEQVNNFLAKIKDGSIDINQLGTMTSSEARHTFFADIVGEENAQGVNALFESKLLLKNQQKGMISFINKVGGLTSATKRDMIFRVERMEKALSPVDEQNFLKDFVDTRLGVNVNAEEAKTIMAFSKTMQENYNPASITGQSEAYATAKQQLRSYLASKIPQEKGLMATIKNLTGFQRALQTGYDFSMALRQAASAVFNKEWLPAMKNSFKYARSQEAYDGLEQKMYMDKNWDRIDPIKHTLGLTNLGEKITQKEETFASTWIGKLSGITAKLGPAPSERAYSGALSELRFNKLSNWINAAEKDGRTVSAQEIKAMAEVIASGTGRGQLGSLEPAANALGAGLFSPRWIASRIQIITNLLPTAMGGAKTGAARMEAAKSIATLAGLSASLIGLVKLQKQLNPDSPIDVETNTLSSDFGKLKVGNTRIDLTFGLGPYIRFLSQESQGKKKSTTTGEIQSLTSGGFGAPTRLSVLGDFFGGKTAPIPSTIIDFLQGYDRSGNVLGIDWTNLKAEKNINSLKRLASMAEPLVAQDTIQAYQDAAGEGILKQVGKGALAFALSEAGIGVQTYSPFEGNSKVKKFKNQTSSGEYNKFIVELSKVEQVNLDNFTNDPGFKALPTKNRASILSKVKNATLMETLNRYGYKE